MSSTLTVPLQNKYIRTDAIVKKAIWLYFWLLIFEGGLRRWVFPELASPLLVVRDPIAIYILISAWLHHRFPVNRYVVIMLFVGFIGIVTALLTGHGNLGVALFGARILLIHFPLMFVIGKYFTRDDVLRMGRVILWITIPMAILIALQFYSPQSAWVNRGLGGDVAGAGFSGAMGYFRPPATFSFVSGTALFFSVSACFIFYFWLNSKTINRLLLIGATIGLIAAIPLSISRSLFYQVVLTALFTGIAVSRKPKFLLRFVGGVIGIVLLLMLVSQASLFQTSTEAFIDRFTLASEAEGGISGTLIDRFLGGMVSAITSEQELPFFGLGIGMGTNAGAQLLTNDRTTFLISEGEWGRLIGELGLLLGFAVIGVRLAFLIHLGKSAYTKLKLGDVLPWLLLSVGALNILQGQWAQPTSLGFSTLLGGLIWASSRAERASKPNLRA